MKKFRIGNDLKMRVSLLKKTNQNDLLNVQTLKAFFINTTMVERHKQKTNSKLKFLSRYPLEPYIEQYMATEYNLNNSGYPSYIAYPHTHLHATYGGFGVYPDWHDHYCPVQPGWQFECMGIVRATENRGIIDVYFPANKQLYTGVYKLVIVADILQNKFSDSNIRTITIDYNNLFELVDSTMDGEGNVITDDDIDVNIDTDQSVTPEQDSQDDIYVISGQYADTGSLQLNRRYIGDVNIPLWDEPDNN